MFRAARDCFARCYGLTRASVIGVPDWLEREEFGLTLAVHMAALVAVDRHVRDTPRPAPGESMLALTAYLLGRESHHWHTLHGTADPLTGARTTFGTDPIRMRRAVFTAVLTGPLGFRDAMAALDAVGVGGDTDRVLTDHTFCYPPADPRTVLEPLYPDRLAEDFLALYLPGHDLPEHQPEAWAATAPETLLASPSGDGTLPPYAARTITFLTAACERWPHLIPTLETLERLLPEDPDDAAGDLAVAAADLTERLAGHRLPTLTDPAARAELYDVLGRWLYQAHQEEKAAAALTEATRLYRPLAAADPRTFEPKLAAAAFYLAMDLALGGRHTSAGRPGGGGLLLHAAVTRCGPPWPARTRRWRRSARPSRSSSRLARDDPAEHQERLAAVICVAALCGPYLGAPEESLALAREGVDLVRRLARDQENLGKDYSDDVAAALMALAGNLVASEPEQAAALAHEAMEILQPARPRQPRRARPRGQPLRDAGLPDRGAAAAGPRRTGRRRARRGRTDPSPPRPAEGFGRPRRLAGHVRRGARPGVGARDRGRRGDRPGNGRAGAPPRGAGQPHRRRGGALSHLPLARPPAASAGTMGPRPGRAARRHRLPRALGRRDRSARHAGRPRHRPRDAGAMGRDPGRDRRDRPGTPAGGHRRRAGVRHSRRADGDDHGQRGPVAGRAARRRLRARVAGRERRHAERDSGGLPAAFPRRHPGA
ncbi:hypothetical protein ACFSTC_38515 [Nonomuraea ferruginea]